MSNGRLVCRLLQTHGKFHVCNALSGYFGVCDLCVLFLNRGYSFIVPGFIISGMGIIVFLFLVVGEFSPFSCPKFIIIYSG